MTVERKNLLIVAAVYSRRILPSLNPQLSTLI